jgi:hypothetical protein
MYILALRQGYGRRQKRRRLERTEKRAPPRLYLVDFLIDNKDKPQSCYAVVVPTKPFQSPFIGWPEID